MNDILFLDGASGTKGDDSLAFARGYYHSGLTVLGMVREIRPPFSPLDAVDEVIAYATTNRMPALWGDNWSGKLLQELIESRARGRVRYHVSPYPKSELYLKLLPLINAGAVRLPDDPVLLKQLRGLERRRSWAGKDRVDHRRGQHDDVANAAAGAIVLCHEGGLQRPVRFWGVGFTADDDAEHEADRQNHVARIRENGNAYFPGIDG